MPAQSPSTYPKLRQMIDAQLIEYANQPYILLRDMLELTPGSLLFPQSLAPVLTWLDGTHDPKMLQTLMQLMFGVQIPLENIHQLIHSLDEALFLENENFQSAREGLLADFRSAKFREPACAPHIYPATAHELKQKLDVYLSNNHHHNPLNIPVRGLISPHIDYARGGAVYAEVWHQAARAAQEAEIAIILGTDHYANSDLITLTRQNYATPYGILPTEQSVVSLIAQAAGESIVFAGEIRHRKEHSIELAAVWLHHMRQGKPVSLVPVLCGNFEPFYRTNINPEENPLIAAFISTLTPMINSPKTLVIAAADLAHVGPAFGGDPLDSTRRAELLDADTRLLNPMRAGNPLSFWDEIRRVQDQNNVCGIAPIYLAMRLLEPTSGKLFGYASCPADQQGTSAVTICGMVFN